MQAYRELTLVMHELSPKEQLYVEARAAGRSPRSAARIAGVRDPKKLEEDEFIRRAVRAVLRWQRQEQRYTRDDIAAGLRDAIEVASTASEMIQGWREIGKLYGLYEPERRETTIRRETVEKMSDDELARLAALEGEYEVLDDVQGGTPDEIPGPEDPDPA